MDVKILSDIIKELIIDHEKVPVKGMGYFVSEFTRSTISEDGKQIFPPSARISFRSDETVSDDSLAVYYAEKNNIDVETIKAETEAFVKDLKSVLRNKKSVDFPGLGVLRSTLEGDIYFVTGDQENFFDNVFYMEPVSVKPLSADDGKGAILSVPVPEAELEKASVEQRKPSAEKPVRKKSNVVAVVISIIAVLVVLFILALVLMKTGLLDELIYSEEELNLIRNSGGFQAAGL